MNVTKLNNLIAARPESSYSQNVMKQIDMISFNKGVPAQPFGSYVYRLQKYPGDIDLVDVAIDCDNGPCRSEKEIIKKFSKRIKEIVLNIVKSKSHYYSEMKCGLDKRYIIKIGDMNDGILTTNTMYLKQIKKLYDDCLLTDTEYYTIMGLEDGLINTQNGFDIITKILRNRYIIRWTANEIIQGKKELPGNKIITLEEAVSHETLCKIDMITIINGRFVEITDVYGLGYYEDNGDIKMLNYTADTRLLPLEVEKLFFSNEYYSPFKVIKRMFSYARYLYLAFKNEEAASILTKLSRFVSGNTSLLYQLKSELETINLIIEKFKKPSPKTINNQIDDMKNRLASVIEINQDDLIAINELIDKIVKADSKNKVPLINKLIRILKELINNFTINFLNANDFNPPPPLMLPSEKLKRIIEDEDIVINPLLTSYHVKTYSWSIIRSPDMDKDLELVMFKKVSKNLDKEGKMYVKLVEENNKRFGEERLERELESEYEDDGIETEYEEETEYEDDGIETEYESEEDDGISEEEELPDEISMPIVVKNTPVKKKKEKKYVEEDDWIDTNDDLIEDVEFLTVEDLDAEYKRIKKDANNAKELVKIQRLPASKMLQFLTLIDKEELKKLNNLNKAYKDITGTPLYSVELGKKTDKKVADAEKQIKKNIVEIKRDKLRRARFDKMVKKRQKEIQDEYDKFKQRESDFDKGINTKIIRKYDISKDNTLTLKEKKKGKGMYGGSIQPYGGQYQFQTRFNNNYPNTFVFKDNMYPLPQNRNFDLPAFQTRQMNSYFPTSSGSYSRNNYNDDYISQNEVRNGVPQLHNQRNIF